jgi:hypothetical protein
MAPERPGDNRYQYAIEYATAHHEAVMTRAKTTMLLLLDGHTPRNSHLARAVQTMLDDEYGHLETTMAQLEEAVLAHYHDPAERVVSEANTKRAEELTALTSRYENHVRRYFQKELRWTEEAVKLVLTLTPVVNLAALRHLNAEVMSRAPGDPVHDGYRDAMIEVADFIPQMRSALARQENQEDYRSPDDRRRLEAALEALDAADAIVDLHR